MQKIDFSKFQNPCNPLNNVLMLFKGTSIHRSDSCGPPPPSPPGLWPQDPDQGAFTSRPPLISGKFGWVFNTTKQSGIKERGLFILRLFFSSAIFFLGHFFLGLVFPVIFSRYHIIVPSESYFAPISAPRIREQKIIYR